MRGSVALAPAIEPAPAAWQRYLDENPHEAKLREIFALARACKQGRGHEHGDVLAGQTWAMIFSKSSTRTLSGGRAW